MISSGSKALLLGRRVWDEAFTSLAQDLRQTKAEGMCLVKV